MTTGQFIAKQRVKYYWKVVTNGSRHDPTNQDFTESAKDIYWQYEPTPRAL